MGADDDVDAENVRDGLPADRAGDAALALSEADDDVDEDDEDADEDEEMEGGSAADGGSDSDFRSCCGCCRGDSGEATFALPLPLALVALLALFALLASEIELRLPTAMAPVSASNCGKD